MKKIIGIIVILLVIALGIGIFALLNNNNENVSNGNINDVTQENAINDSNANRYETNGEEENTRQIRVSDGTNSIMFLLNESAAAISFYEQLPLTIDAQNYSTNEKIFYPEEELDTSDAPLASGGLGVLAYYEPWGNVVMFYGDFRENASLYALGTAITGAEMIENLSGEIMIEQVR